MNEWLCDLAHRLSHYAFADLQQAAQSQGHLQLSEEGISHVLTRLIWKTAIEHGRAHQVFVREVSRQQESVLGADLELWFTDGTDGLAWRIQAKRLYPPKLAEPPRFTQLPHKIGKRTLQATALINGVRDAQVEGEPVVGIYWLYSFNPVGSDCTGLRDCRCGAESQCEGILVAKAERVRQVILQRKQMVEPLSFHRWSREATPLHALWCPAAFTGTWSDALTEMARRTRDLSPEFEGPTALPDRIRSVLASSEASSIAPGLSDRDQIAPALSSVAEDEYEWNVNTIVFDLRE